MKNIKLKELNNQYELVCNEIVKRFCAKQKIEFDYWIGDKVGVIALFASQYFIALDDIIFDLNSNQPNGLILDWQNDSVDYNTRSESKKYISYPSYANGERYEQINA
ncbi:MAG: hypothetical protein KDD49_03905 [Bacteroidetes bacterium]|nr:hypothetical protein [Bacteroidota bacterium]